MFFVWPWLILVALLFMLPLVLYHPHPRAAPLENCAPSTTRTLRARTVTSDGDIARVNNAFDTWQKPSMILIVLRHSIYLVIVLMLIAWFPFHAAAQTNSPAQDAEQIRAALVQAQLHLEHDNVHAQQALADAQSVYRAALIQTLTRTAPETDARIQAEFIHAQQALAQRDASGFTAARVHIWSSLLQASYTTVTHAIQQHDAATAKAWLPLREFRRATRVARPNADATLAINSFAAGALPADAALAAVTADLLDAYQSRLIDALRVLVAPDIHHYTMKHIEAATLVDGYFAILAPTFEQQRGAAARAALQQELDLLRQTVRTGDPTTLHTTVAHIISTIEGFRAVPLSDADRANRASKINRYIGLIAPNYGRGTRDGHVINQIEVEEARTFRTAAEDALADLLPDLQARDATRTAQFQADLATLRDQIEHLAAPSDVQATVDSANSTFNALVPAEWLQTDPSADFDAIRDLLTQITKAVTARQYPQAESARLEAYSILDAGPEIRLRALAPDQAADLSGLFWQGNGSLPGLANLIADRADAATVQTTITGVNKALNTAQNTVGSGNATPGAVIGNAAVIIFRQGLEAVVILASIFAGLRKESDRRFRRPLLLGALGAGIASIITWFVLRAILSQFAQFGGRLEAIVSIIAVAVLLVILNWFFHNIYWVGWLSNIQQRKKRGISAEAGQIMALVAVGFTSVYREGFETALFAQVLVLEAGPSIVIQGLLLGAFPVVALALITFVLQAKLPYKNLLIVSGVLISLVLIQMMGQTIHAMQAVRWMSMTPIHGVEVPYWMGVWFGIYPTWEGVIAQVAALIIVLGSYFLAEQHQRRKQAKTGTAPATTQQTRKLS